MSDWPCLQPRGEGCVLHVAVVPQARKTGADGWHDGHLRVRLTAPPVEGQANDALVRWLAAELGVPRRAVQVLRGATARRKQIAIEASAAQVGRWLSGLSLEPPPA